MKSCLLRRATLTGWSLTLPSRTEKVVIHTEDAPTAIENRRGFIVRGAGRSYGDCASLRDGQTIELVDTSIAVDPQGVLSVTANATVGDVLEYSVPRGWFLPVTPGTSHATMGGLVASDVHGKNHHHNGSLGRHIMELKIVDASGTVVTASRSENTDLFLATIGGMGLTGVILQIAVQMTKIETSLMEVTHSKHSDMDSLMAAMLENDDAFEYSVAWVDMSTYGNKAGRGLLSRGKHLKIADLPAEERGNPLKYSRPPVRNLPVRPPFKIINRATTWAFNKLWYHKFHGKNKTGPEDLNSFFYPLDKVTNWNKAYRRGVLQYQFVVPHKATEVLREVARLFMRDKCPIFLVVLKQMGDEGEGLLSFPLKGWTLAVDVPADHKDILDLLDKADQLVAAAGGRVYLAKDSRINYRHIPTMYPRLTEFKEIQRAHDPEGRIRSDMARRLRLC